MVSWNVSCFFRLALNQQEGNNNEGVGRKSPQVSSGALSIQSKIPEISVDTSNGTDHFDLVWLEYSVHFDQSGYLSRWDWNVPFHKLTKLLPPVPLFCILPTRTMTKRTVAWVSSVQPKYTVPLGTWNFPTFQTRIFVEWKAPLIYCYRLLSVYLVCACESMGD